MINDYTTQKTKGQIDRRKLDEIAKETGVEISVFGNNIEVSGDDAEVDEALAKINENFEDVEEVDMPEHTKYMFEEGDKFNDRGNNRFKSYSTYEIVDFNCPPGYANCLVTYYSFNAYTMRFTKHSTENACVEERYLMELKKQHGRNTI